MARAIAAFGSQKKLGKAIGYTQGAISYALNTRVSADMAAKIETATKGKVRREVLCPRFFERPAA